MQNVFAVNLIFVKIMQQVCEWIICLSKYAATPDKKECLATQFHKFASFFLFTNQIQCFPQIQNMMIDQN